jgi:hypothetical protein
MKNLLFILCLLHFIAFVMALFNEHLMLAVFSLVLSTLYMLGYVYIETTNERKV